MSIWFQAPTLEALNAFCANTLLEQLGITYTEIGDNYLCAAMPVDRRTHQPLGILHGGASVALAETLASTAGFLTIDKSKFTAVGLDINANHVKMAKSGLVIGKALPLHLGKSTQVWETKIINEQQQLISISRMTIAIIRRRHLDNP